MVQFWSTEIPSVIGEEWGRREMSRRASDFRFKLLLFCHRGSDSDVSLRSLPTVSIQKYRSTVFHPPASRPIIASSRIFSATCLLKLRHSPVNRTATRAAEQGAGHNARFNKLTERSKKLASLSSGALGDKLFFGLIIVNSESNMLGFTNCFTATHLKL